jgi:hypothetical protein
MMTENMFALWTWPFQMATYATDLAETALSAQKVVAARMPMIAAAVQNPGGGGHGEMVRMVGEKMRAADLSRRSIERAHSTAQRAASSNARALGRIATGQFLWPSQWLQLVEANMAAAAAMVQLPSAALAPIRTRASSNVRRLGAPSART